MQLSVKFDRQRLLASVDRLKAGVQDTATVRSLNTAARSVRTDVSRSIAGQYRTAKLSSRQVLKRLRLLRANRAQLVSGVEALGALMLPLSLFAGAQNRRGVPVRVFGAQGTILHAFLKARRFGGGEGVFMRAADWRVQQFPGGISGRRHRIQKGLDFPIAELKVPGIPKVFLQDAVVSGMHQVGRAAFNRELARQLKLVSENRNG